MAHQFLVILTIGALLPRPSLHGGSPLAAQRRPVLTTTQIAARVIPATVTIEIFGASGEHIKQGSGFLIRPDGVVLTNYHVMAGGHTAVVRMASGAEFSAVRGLVGDSVHDLAILRVVGNSLRTIDTFRDSLPIGSKVVVVGTPIGLEATVSEGIVSGRRRLGDTELIQMTAPISPGSSGGPVVNDRGEAIGISVLTVTTGQALNFAVPIRYALDLLATSSTEHSLVALFPSLEPVQVTAGGASAKDEPDGLGPQRSYVVIFDSVMSRNSQLVCRGQGILLLGDPQATQGWGRLAATCYKNGVRNGTDADFTVAVVSINDSSLTLTKDFGPNLFCTVKATYRRRGDRLHLEGREECNAGADLLAGTWRGESLPGPDSMVATSWLAAPRVYQSLDFKHFRFDAQGCWQEPASGILCQFNVTNTDSTGKANQSLWIGSADAWVGGIKFRATAVAISDQVQDVRGISQVKQKIPTGIQIPLITGFVEAGGSPATSIDVKIRVSIGTFGDEKDVWFRRLPILLQRPW